MDYERRREVLYLKTTRKVFQNHSKDIKEANDSIHEGDSSLSVVLVMLEKKLAPLITHQRKLLLQVWAEEVLSLMK